MTTPTPTPMPLTVATPETAPTVPRGPGPLRVAGIAVTAGGGALTVVGGVALAVAFSGTADGGGGGNCIGCSAKAQALMVGV